MVPSVVHSIKDSKVLGSTRPTGNLLTNTLLKPMLASVEEDAVAEFLRLEFEYRAQAARHQVEPDALRSLIDPAFHPVIEDLAKHYGFEIPNLSILNVGFKFEHDMAELADLMEQWDAAARDTLQILVGDDTHSPTVDEAKEHLNKVKWNAKLKTFKSTLHTYMAHYRQTVRQFRLQEVIDNNGRQIVRHLIDHLYPEAFKRKVAAENLKRGKLTLPAELFTLLDELEPHFEGAIDQLRLQREYTRQPTKFATSKSPWEAQMANTGHHSSHSRTTDASKSMQTTRASQPTRTPTSQSQHAVRMPHDRPGPVQQTLKPSDVPHARDRQPFPAAASKTHSSRGQTDELQPLSPCKYCGAMHWHKDCQRNPFKDAARTHSTRPADGRHKAHGKAATLTNDEVDGHVSINHLTLPFTIDTGASHNFASYAVARSLIHGDNVFTEELLPPIKVSIASRDSTHFATHKLRTHATVTLDTGEQRTMNNMVLYLVTDFTDEILLGRPALLRLGIDIKAQLRRVFATPTMPEEIQPDGNLTAMESASPKAFSANLTSLDMPDESDLAMDEELSFLEIGDVQSDAIKDAISSSIDKAAKEGLTSSSCDRLHTEIINTDLLDAFRTTMAADPPADIPPVKISFKPTIYDVTHGPRRYSPLKTAFMDAHLATLETYGYVRHNSCAAIASPAHPVRKATAKPDDPPEAQFRLTVDLRAVNSATQPMHYPLPLLDTITRVVAGAMHFATIDLNNGYWQIPHSPGESGILLNSDR